MKFIKKIPVIIVAVLMSWILLAVHGLSGLGMYAGFREVYDTFTLILMVSGILSLAAVTFLVKKKNRILLLMQVLIFAFLSSLDVLFRFCIECFFYDYLDFGNGLLIVGNIILSGLLFAAIKVIYRSRWGMV